MAYRFDVYQATDGYRWRLKAPNGEIVADSGESYTTKSNAVRAVRSLIDDMREGDSPPDDG